MPNNVAIGLTGFAAFCAAVIKDPVVSFVLILAILLTCMTVIIHIWLSCWKANRKGVRRARAATKPRKA